MERDREINPFVWVLIFIIGAAVIGVGAWGFRVLTSEVKGEGDAIIQRNSAENWTAAQARFEENYAEIVATDLKIIDAKARMEASPDDEYAEATYYGTQSYCRSVVADYNADANKFLAGDFRSADLPEYIGSDNPLTDCEA